jgi:hypothetical protein
LTFEAPKDQYKPQPTQRQTPTSICRGAFSWIGIANGDIGKYAQQIFFKDAGDSEGANTQPNGCGVKDKILK